MGSILITQEGVETSTIEENHRDESLYNFYMMLNKALAAGDCFFMTEEAYAHEYSYGEYYPSFVHLSWDEFRQKESLRGVSWKTYYDITNNFRNRLPKKVTNEEEFERQNEPKGKGGFEHADNPEDFLYNIAHWEKWHCDYLTDHPEKTKREEDSSFIPNVDEVYKILKEEILSYIENKCRDRISQATNAEQEIKKIWDELFANKDYHDDQDITRPIKKNATALFFHHVVMRSKEQASMISYCKEIGDKVCRKNYYKYVAELSSEEQRACGSLRRIYCIEKNGGKQYISLDFHKGMFEFHDEKGRHLGEFLFDGTQNKKAEESHNLKTLK